jgi:hypothetical protein
MDRVLSTPIRRLINSLTSVSPLYRNAALVLGGVVAVLLAVHESKEAHAGFFEVPFLEYSERDFYVRLWWMWRAFVYLPALTIGFFANGKPMLLSGAAYMLSALVLSFNGHGPYGFEDSLASLVIFGDIHHYLHPYASHGVLILRYLLEVGEEIAPAVALAWLGSWLRHRLTIGSSNRESHG